MDENKNLENLEEVAEEAIEAAEAVIEDAVEPVEELNDAVENVVSDAEEAIEEAVEAAEALLDGQDVAPVLEEVKKSKVGVIVSVVLVIAIIAAACVYFLIPKNKYNKMGYVDISGKTVQDMADQMGVDLATFLAQYGLPEDMPADTTESAAYYNIPVKIMAQMFGMDYATMKETLHFPETITEETTWGEAEGEVLLKDYIGEDNLDAFKQQYGFGDEVTLETKWKDVRYQVDMAQKEMRIEQEKAAEEAAKKAAEEAIQGEDPVDESGDAPAEEPVDDAAEVPAE